MGFLSYATFLEYFAIETDALLSYDSVHYQDYNVNRAPIHRAFTVWDTLTLLLLLSKRTHAFTSGQ